MNENNINPSSTQNKKKDNEKTKDNWEVVADILDELQSFVITEPAPMAHSVIKEAAQLIAERCWHPSSLPSSDSPIPFPIPNLQFSIVYQPYRDITLNVALERNQIISGDLKLDTSGLGNFQDRIEQVVRTGQVDLDSSGHNLIVPMRLDPKAKAKKGQYLPPRRIIGAFLLEADNDYSFKKEDARLFDRFSDGVAVLIQLGDSKARTEVTNKLHSEYLGNIGQFESEFKIFDKLIDSLTNNEIRYSYAANEINILLYHSFYQDQLYIVCENGKLKESFRKEATYSFDSDRLRSLLGDFKKQSNEIKEFISDDYPSNIVVPILVHHDNKIGYLILRTQQENAYQNEKNLLRRTAGFLAATLRSFRHDTWEQQLDKFLIQNIENNAEDEQSWADQDNIENEKSQADEKLYNAVVRVLEHIYGSVELAIVGLSLEDKTPAFTFKHGENWDELSLLSELEKYIYRVNLEPFRSENKLYYIYNITAESGRITNFFIIKMTRDSVRTTHRFIQHLLAMVGTKQSFMRKKERLYALTAFSEAVTNFKFDTYDSEGLSKLYNMAHTETHKVMSTSNMYIAILDRKTQEITFPLFKKKDEKTGEIKNILVEPRIFNNTTENIPRTEYILATKKPILINTKEESVKWYKDHGNSEKLGDSFASWVGVPIISEGEAIGVIVVYHPVTEYLYTKESDGVFLKNIAMHLSSLLVRVEEEKGRRELKKAINDAQALNAILLNEENSTKLFITRKLSNAINVDLAEVQETLHLSKTYIDIKKLPSEAYILPELYDASLKNIENIKSKIDKTKNSLNDEIQSVVINSLIIDVIRDEYKDNPDMATILSFKLRSNSCSVDTLTTQINDKSLYLALHYLIKAIYSGFNDSKQKDMISYKIEDNSHGIYIIFYLAITKQEVSRKIIESPELKICSNIVKIKLNGNFNKEINNDLLELKIIIPNSNNKQVLVCTKKVWSTRLVEAIKNAGSFSVSFYEYIPDDFEKYDVFIIDLSLLDSFKDKSKDLEFDKIFVWSNEHIPYLTNTDNIHKLKLITMDELTKLRVILNE